ncbi:YdcF family protein [bacterium]|nr:YdcF family protein [bacterium]
MTIFTRIASVILVGGVLAGSWDFLQFVSRADALRDPSPPERADGVAALTGASNARIRAGVELAAALDKPLLISGVHPDTTAMDIAGIAGVPSERITCCVTLGRSATTTVGNGSEVADWARANGLNRIIVVTSDYHMDRALLELTRAMPEADFQPYAVASGEVRPRAWYTEPGTARRLFEEWAKFRTSTLLGPAAIETRSGEDPASDEAAADGGSVAP